MTRRCVVVPHAVGGAVLVSCGCACEVSIGFPRLPDGGDGLLLKVGTYLAVGAAAGADSTCGGGARNTWEVHLLKRNTPLGG